MPSRHFPVVLLLTEPMFSMPPPMVLLLTEPMPSPLCAMMLLLTSCMPSMLPSMVLVLTKPMPSPLCAMVLLMVKRLPSLPCPMVVLQTMRMPNQPFPMVLTVRMLSLCTLGSLMLLHQLTLPGVSIMALMMLQHVALLRLCRVLHAAIVVAHMCGNAAGQDLCRLKDLLVLFGGQLPWRHVLRHAVCAKACAARPVSNILERGQNTNTTVLCMQSAASDIMLHNPSGTLHC